MTPLAWIVFLAAVIAVIALDANHAWARQDAQRRQDLADAIAQERHDEEDADDDTDDDNDWTPGTP